MQTLAQSHRQAFVSILIDHIGMSTMDVREVTNRLSPLFEIIENGGVYPLSEGDQFVTEALASQMRELTGREDIKRAVILSRKVLLQERSQPEILPLYAERCFVTRLPSHRWVNEGAAALLLGAIQDHILPGITEAMNRGMHKERPEFVAMVMQNVLQLVFNYCSAALLGNRDRMGELDMPIAFIASIIPLGIKKNDETTFLYLGD